MASEDKVGEDAVEPGAPSQPVRPGQQQPVDAGQPDAGGGARLKWYVVHTYSGHENKARLSLQERVKQMGLDRSFGQVLIPTESVLEMVKGQRRTTTRKFYPGYMFVQMELNEATYHLVKNTPKITGFLGGQNPTPVPERDIAQINTQMN